VSKFAVTQESRALFCSLGKETGLVGNGALSHVPERCSYSYLNLHSRVVSDPWNRTLCNSESQRKRDPKGTVRSDNVIHFTQPRSRGYPKCGPSTLPAHFNIRTGFHGRDSRKLERRSSNVIQDYIFHIALLETSTSQLIATSDRRVRLCEVSTQASIITSTY
jgi:hypothetical protein